MSPPPDRRYKIDHWTSRFKPPGCTICTGYRYDSSRAVVGYVAVFAWIDHFDDHRLWLCVETNTRCGDKDDRGGWKWEGSHMWFNSVSYAQKHDKIQKEYELTACDGLEIKGRKELDMDEVREWCYCRLCGRGDGLAADREPTVNRRLYNERWEVAMQRQEEERPEMEKQGMSWWAEAEMEERKMLEEAKNEEDRAEEVEEKEDGDGDASDEDGTDDNDADEDDADEDEGDEDEGDDNEGDDNEGDDNDADEDGADEGDTDEEDADEGDTDEEDADEDGTDEDDTDEDSADEEDADDEHESGEDSAEEHEREADESVEDMDMDMDGHEPTPPTHPFLSYARQMSRVG